ncbi:MFS transporter [Corynebacterium aquilae]|uniref:Major facilitator superfamily (MFS) profile domain-containing protein n=1 Tax=Corynebacterium aquilae DSM 44791 TaxID=1431546 RepID=A0A1L7CHB1_9CORY|nr:MFS transporter [Corynebacterium aquilae]APT85205.1 hypothetical protein CAQU_09110 [Corynebacterium aquilae DSM 44791]
MSTPTHSTPFGESDSAARLSALEQLKTKRRPKIFAATFVSEISVGAHVGGVGALIVLLAQSFGTSINTFTILSSFLGIGMIVYSLISPWIMRATAGLVLKTSSTMVILGALGLAFAPWIWLVIVSGLLVGSGASLVILIVPAVLAGPRRARDIALANGASSAASIAAPLLYGFFDSLPHVQGRWAALMLALPAVYVLATIRSIDFVDTPSAFAERLHNKVGRKRAKDLADAFGTVSSVRAFGGAENVADDELARAAVAQAGSPVHVPDLYAKHEDPSFNEQSTRAVRARFGLKSSKRKARGVAGDAPKNRKGFKPRLSTPAVVTRTKERIQYRTKRELFYMASCLVRVALSLVTEFALYTWGVARLMEIGVQTSTAATLGAVFPLGMAAGRLSAGVLIKWRYIFPASVLASLSGGLIVGLGVSLPQLIFGLLIAGFGTALLYPITVDDMVALPKLSPNRAAALCSLGGGTTVFLLPLLLPLVQDVLTLGESLLLLAPVTIVLWLLPTGRKAFANSDQACVPVAADKDADVVS